VAARFAGDVVGLIETGKGFFGFSVGDALIVMAEMAIEVAETVQNRGFTARDSRRVHDAARRDR
jgi:hypothetical protein